MWDDLSGVVSRSDHMGHFDYNKIYLSTKNLSIFEKLHLQLASVCTNPDWYTSVHDPTFDYNFQSHFAPDRATHRSQGISQIVGQGSSHEPPSLPSHRAEPWQLHCLQKCTTETHLEECVLVGTWSTSLNWSIFFWKGSGMKDVSADDSADGFNHIWQLINLCLSLSFDFLALTSRQFPRCHLDSVVGWT